MTPWRWIPNSKDPRMMKAIGGWVHIQIAWQVWPIFAYEIPLQRRVGTSGSLRKECVTWNGRPKGLLASLGLAAGRTAYGSKRLCESSRGAIRINLEGMWRVWESSRSACIACGSPIFSLDRLQLLLVSLIIQKKNHEKATASLSH